MYGVVRTRQFERAFRKLKKSGTLKPSLKREIDEMILTLAARKALDANYKDHQLTGEFAAYRECHVRGDLLLVYELRHDKRVLVLVNVGSHSQIFG